MTAFSFDLTLRARIAGNLARFSTQAHDAPGLRAAAVAIVVTHDADRDLASILLTMRPQKLNRHGGQYALPGGRLDPGETDTEAALRELQEELGLSLGPDDILGELDQFPTRSGFRISPVVMWCASSEGMKPDPSEVAQVFFLPLEELDSPDFPRLIESANSEHPVLSGFFPTLGHNLYAPTAAILYQFREVALRGAPTRAAHFDQPAFAWK